MTYYTRSRVSTALYSPLIENGYEISNDGKKPPHVLLKLNVFIIPDLYKRLT